MESTYQIIDDKGIIVFTGSKDECEIKLQTTSDKCIIVLVA